MHRILISPDKFKGSLTASQAALAIGQGIRSERPDAQLTVCPVADGGEGTLDVFVSAGYERIETDVSGPTGERVRTAFARHGDVAVLEMADACGLRRLSSGLAATTATSRGLGELMLAALDVGCRTLVVAVGGSASTDGGAGLVQALGGRVLDSDARRVRDGGAALGEAFSLDLTGLDPRLAETSILVAADVDNPLTGERGAACVYGPQKGASTDDTLLLDSALNHWADLVANAKPQFSDRRNSPAAGAAGGVGFALLAILDATVTPGIELILDLLGFDEHLSDADLVITGEGSLDEQSLHGKAPVGVATAARGHGIPVVAVCGRSLLTLEDLIAAGFVGLYSLEALEPDPARSMSRAQELLESIGRTLARTHMSHTPMKASEPPVFPAS